MTRSSTRAAAAGAGNDDNDGSNAGAQVAFSLRPGHRQGEIISMNTKQGYNLLNKVKFLASRSIARNYNGWTAIMVKPQPNEFIHTYRP